MSETTHQSQTLEHLGLVAGMFDELGIGELIDELIPQDFAQRQVSVLSFGNKFGQPGVRVGHDYYTQKTTAVRS